MSTSASFRAFIPALTFFFAIARARRRIRAARGVVVVADSRATRDGPPRDGPARVDRRRRFETIDDASIDTKIDRRRVDLFFDDANIDRPTDRPTIQFNSIVDRRRDGATRRRRLTSRRPTTTIERATRSRRTRRERTRGDDDDDDDDDAFGGNHRTRAGDGCARATTARDARARRATRGGRDGARDAVATRARGRERVRWFDAGEAGARIANASIRLDGSDADAAGRTRRRDDGKGARVR